MNAMYHLKNLRINTAYDEACLSASIWLEDKEIGSFRDCPDSGRPLFEFSRPSYRKDFEDYIESWWKQSGQIDLCNLHLQELVDKNIAHDLSAGTKMRCWITLQTGSPEHDMGWKWQPRSSREPWPASRSMRTARRA